jgi:hypothetical protein
MVDQGACGSSTPLSAAVNEAPLLSFLVIRSPFTCQRGCKRETDPVGKFLNDQATKRHFAPAFRVLPLLAMIVISSTGCGANPNEIASPEPSQTTSSPSSDPGSEPGSEPGSDSGSGPGSESVTVPPGIVGNTVGAAVLLLDEAGLEHTQVEEQVPYGSESAGKIIQVDPGEGSVADSSVVLTIGVEGPDPAGLPDFTLFTLPQCDFVPGGALSGADALGIQVAVRNSGPGDWESLVPFSLVSDTGLQAQGNTAISAGSSFTSMQVDVGLGDSNRAHRFTITVDPNNEEAERNEDNNSIEVLVVLPPRPNTAVELSCVAD